MRSSSMKHVLLPITMSLMLIACGSSDAPATAASNAPWPETPFMPQTDPDTVLLPCVLVGTIGLEGSLGQADDTRAEVTGPDVGNGRADGPTSDAPPEHADPEF